MSKYNTIREQLRVESDKKYQEPDPSQSSREGVCKKYINDPRITLIGRFIRKYSIDELPQLFNMPNVKSVVILFYGQDAEFRIVAGRSFIQNMNEIQATLKMLGTSKGIKLNFHGAVYTK